MRILLIYLEPLANEPIGLLYIATVLEKNGHRTKIIGREKNKPLSRILKEAVRFNPQVVGISIPTALANQADQIAAVIKKRSPQIRVIAGGPHPSILPLETLSGKNIDICVIGEGEITVVDLIDAIENNRNLKDVKGIAYLEGKELVTTGARDYITDLDSLPFVDRYLMPKRVIYGRAGYPLGNPCMLLIATRGCPFQCSFCQPTVSRMFGCKVRRRSAENVFEEILELKKRYGISGLWINDDTFSAGADWVGEFCDYMIREKPKVSWYANGRINNFDENLLIKMRDAGCVGLVMTPETGSERIRNEVLNKQVSDEQIFKAYEISKRIGLPFQANIMLGSPGETERDLQLSKDLIKKIQPHMMNVSYTTALPGTRLYEKYRVRLKESQYYRDYEDYDIGRLKKMDCDIAPALLEQTRDFFESKYGISSFGNRARHFWEFAYFRKILYSRWKTLLFSPHPKFRHFLFDIAAIVFGSIIYLKNIKLYRQQD